MDIFQNKIGGSWIQDYFLKFIHSILFCDTHLEVIFFEWYKAVSLEWQCWGKDMILLETFEKTTLGSRSEIKD